MSTTEGNLAQSTELSVEEQVAAIMKEDPQGPADGQPAPKADPSTASAATAPSPELPGQPPTETEPAVVPLEDQLKTIEEEDKQAQTESKLTADQEEILKAIPTIEAGRQLYVQAQGYQALAGAFTSGDFETVEQMFSSFNKEQAEAFDEYLYKKHLSGNEPAWIQRWIEERDPQGNPHVVKAVSGLQKEINSLKNQLAASGKAKESEALNAQQAQLVRQYHSHVDGLFDRINFAKEDRPWVANAIHNKVMADPEVAKNLRAGRFTAVNKVFATTVSEYTKRASATDAAKDSKLAAQAAKKPILPGSQPVQSELPDDINQVPKDKREGWMASQIGKLFASKK